MACLYSCVQQTHKKTVVYTLVVNNQKNVETAGIRGYNPLKWDADTTMTEIVKDSMYRLAITYVTGYKGTRAIFTVNGKEEPDIKPNRSVEFAAADTTFYKAVFNKQ
jgi:hypothetical protein